MIYWALPILSSSVLSPNEKQPLGAVFFIRVLGYAVRNLNNAHEPQPSNDTPEATSTPPITPIA